MQPLRKDHVDHYKEFVRDEFSIASNHVEQEISQQSGIHPRYARPLYISLIFIFFTCFFSKLNSFLTSLIN